MILLFLLMAVGNSTPAFRDASSAHHTRNWYSDLLKETTHGGPTRGTMEFIEKQARQGLGGRPRQPSQWDYNNNHHQITFSPGMVLYIIRGVMKGIGEELTNTDRTVLNGFLSDILAAVDLCFRHLDERDGPLYQDIIMT
jgi:hypothetical protein